MTTILVPAKHQTVTGYGLLIAYMATMPLLIGLAINVFSSGNITRLMISTQVSVYAISVVGLGLVWLLRKKYTEELGLGILIVGHLVWFALPALFQALSSTIWFGYWTGLPVSNSDLYFAGIQISLFLLANYLGFYLISKRQTSTFRLHTLMLSTSGARIIAVSICLGIGLLPYIVFGGGISAVISGIFGGRVDKAWALSAGNAAAYEGNFVMTFFWLTRAFLIVSGNLAGCYLITERSSTVARKVLYVVAVTVPFLILFFDQGTRSSVAMLLIPIVVVFMQNSIAGRASVNIGSLILRSVGISILLLSLTQLQLQFRLQSSGTISSDSDIWSLVTPKSQTDFYTETAYAVATKDAIMGRNLLESPLLMIAVNPIPRAIWPEKPKSDVVWYYSLYRWRGHDIWEKGGNALPSVVGQYYLSGGTLGTIWGGFLFGCLTALFNSFTRRTYFEQVLLASSGLAMLFVSFRLLGPGFHYPVILLWLIISLYPRLIQHNNNFSAIHSHNLLSDTQQNENRY